MFFFILNKNYPYSILKAQLTHVTQLTALKMPPQLLHPPLQLLNLTLISLLLLLIRHPVPLHIRTDLVHNPRFALSLAPLPAQPHVVVASTLRHKFGDDQKRTLQPPGCGGEETRLGRDCAVTREPGERGVEYRDVCLAGCDGGCRHGLLLLLEDMGEEGREGRECVFMCVRAIEWSGRAESWLVMRI